MTTRHEFCLKGKTNLIKEKENGLSYRILSEKLHISVGVLRNIIKRTLEYTNDY